MARAATFHRKYFRTPFCREYWRQAFSELKNTRTLVFAAIILALRLALKWAEIPIATDVNITFGFIANALGSMVYGPVVALLSGALSDTLGFLVKPSGFYYPLYIIPEMAGSFVFALFLYSTDITHLRLILSKFCINLFVNILLSAPIHMRYQWLFYGRTYEPFVWLRIVKNIVMLPLEAVILIFVFKAMIPAISRVGFTPPGAVKLDYTKKHVALIIALAVIGLASVGWYVVYDYNTKSFSADYTAQERLEKNKEMNAWVAEEGGKLKVEESVTVIESARSKAFDREMTYELAIYKIDMEKYQAKHEAAEAALAAGEEDAKPYTMDTINGYSKSKPKNDDTLVRIGTATAVTDKHTGERLRIEITWTWNEEEKE